MANYSIPKTYLWTYLHNTFTDFKNRLLGYRSYRALLTQTGTNPPVATVVENTLKLETEYVYTAPGQYLLITNNLSMADPTTTVDGKKVEVFITPSLVNYPNPPLSSTVNFSAYFIFFQQVYIEAGTDDVFGTASSQTIEIRVYN